MRRKEKYIANGAVIGFVGIAAGDIIFQWFKHWQRGMPFTWNSYNGKQTLKHALIGSAVGAGIGYLAYESKLSDESNHPFNSDEHLRKVLSEENLKSDPVLLKKYLSYKSEVKKWLREKFAQKLAYQPEDAGSFFKRTAIISNCDLDIILPFKRSSYTTLEQMYYDVHEVLQRNFGNQAVVSKQTKAIGLTFEHNGLPIHFDIVPGREINDYKNTKDLNLYVRRDWAWQRGSSFKTNVSLQQRATTNLPAARRTIKLMKSYRDKNDLPISSVLLEQCVCDALSNHKYGTRFSDTENLLNSMIHVARKIKQENIIDVANTNNNLLNKMSESDKTFVATFLETDIQRIETNPRYIKEIF
ncbi:hypothetical protein QWZ08_00360 [Ferruginibacter paludis]|uniref:hypothetical protein n=1 Tax=Ferruginibacter paludis TaxID=1310417 RepID=UPI0025B5E2C5|nr:hypothetical protein [Ferruginibacter paludis]MDN3654053.1 hypothetical protein [Ferruginibacter paludis]